MNKPLRVGLLGCGQVSGNHLIAWQRCKDAELVAVCDTALENAKARAQQFGIGAVYDSPEKMFAAERLELVDIVTPRDTHGDLVRLAAHFGVHVLCEKPLSPTLAEAEVLVREMQGKVRLMVNENWRFRPYYGKIREWIAAGRLGTLIHGRVSLWRSALLRNEEGVVPSLQRMPFMMKERRLLIAESLIHDLDVARSVFGEMKVIGARIGRFSEDIIGEDTAAILLEADTGMTVIVDGTFCAAGHHPRASNKIEIAGSRCSVHLEDSVARLFGAEQEEAKFDEEEARQMCFDRSIVHFVENVRSGKPFWNSAEDQLKTLKLLEDAYDLAGSIRIRR